MYTQNITAIPTTMHSPRLADMCPACAAAAAMSDSNYDHLMDNTGNFLDRLGMADGSASYTRNAVSAAAWVGAAGASLYGLYKWRNPPGSKKQRWVLPVIGAIVAGNIATGVTYTLMGRTGSDGMSDFGKQTPGGWAIVIGSAGLIAASVAMITRKGGFLGDGVNDAATAVSDGNTKRIAARRKRNGFYQKDGAVYWRGNYNGAIRDWMIIRPDGKPANQKAIVQKLIKTYHEKNQ